MHLENPLVCGAILSHRLREFAVLDRLAQWGRAYRSQARRYARVRAVYCRHTRINFRTTSSTYPAAWLGELPDLAGPRSKPAWTRWFRTEARALTGFHGSCLGLNSIGAGLIDPRRVSWKVPNPSPDDPAGTRQTMAVQSTEIAAPTELRSVAAERAVPWRSRGFVLRALKAPIRPLTRLSGLATQPGGEFLAELLHLGSHHKGAVGLLGMVAEIFLVIGFSFIEHPCRLDERHNWGGENLFRG